MRKKTTSTSQIPAPEDIPTGNKKEHSYLGNSQVKRDGVEHSFTPEQVQEYLRCARDPVYFAKRWMKVIHVDHGLVPFELYDYQEKMLRHFEENRFSIVLACRQSGKCVTEDTEIKLRVRGGEPFLTTIGKFHKIIAEESIRQNKYLCETEYLNSLLEKRCFRQKSYQRAAWSEVTTNETRSQGKIIFSHESPLGGRVWEENERETQDTGDRRNKEKTVKSRNWADMHVGEQDQSKTNWTKENTGTSGTDPAGSSKSCTYRKNMPSLWKNRKGTKYDEISFRQLQDEKKFIESIEFDGFEIWSDTGWQPVFQSHKTIKYDVWRLITASGLNLECADNHIVFVDQKQIFVKDLVIGDKIDTISGVDTVISIEKTNQCVNMYDLGVNSYDHRYYTNGILSHNSISSVAYILWKVLFHPEQSVAILANKGATAAEMLGRLTLALENIPFFLQPGCKVLNKTSITFSNNSTVFSASTSSSSIRGKSCVTGDTNVCVMTDSGGIYYTSIEKGKNINKSEFVYNEDTFMNSKYKRKYYTVYELTNTLNNKKYVGFHSTDDLDDGYLGSGKLIKHAVEKYGPDVFEKTYLGIFDNKDEAEALEVEIVDRAFVEDDTTYNLSLGGNVCILYGESNGFYGKKHSEQTRKKISERKYTHSNETKQKISESLKLLYDRNPELREQMSIRQMDHAVSKKTRQKLSKAHAGKIVSPETRQKLSVAHKNRFENYSESEYQNWYNKTFTEERNKRLSESLKGRAHPWQDKINKNPNKIAKTAEAHRGMKRTEEAKERMSKAAKLRGAPNKGKVYCYNPNTNEKKCCLKEEIPEGWVRGFLKCKS